jgi:hypothetical protein
LITADGGGSNVHRSRLWKRELQRLANEFELTISVCHFPPGTSKWNRVEHRLFSFISSNRRGEPPRDYETIAKLISSTKTAAGLPAACRPDRGGYPIGIRISKREMTQLNLAKNNFHGEWNYTITPKK